MPLDFVCVFLSNRMLYLWSCN